MTTQLDGNAIVEIERLVEAKELIITDGPEPRGVYFIRLPDGTLEKHRAELDAANVTVRDLNSLTRVITESLAAGAARRVLVDDSAAVLENENGTATHRWQVTLPLPTHPAHALVASWVRPSKYTQKELVRLLRTQLSLYVDATLVATLNALKFTDNREGSAQVGAHTSGLSKSVQQKVSAENGTSIPEYLLLGVPVYDIPEDRTQRYEIKVYLEYDFEEGVFILAAVNDDVRRAREQAVQKIITHLRETSDGLTVLYGTPKSN